MTFGVRQVERRIEEWKEWDTRHDGDRPPKPMLTKREVLEFSRVAMITLAEPLNRVRFLISEHTDEQTKGELSEVFGAIDRVQAATLGLDKLCVEHAIQNLEEGFAGPRP
jgi:hypothetical protein